MQRVHVGAGVLNQTPMDWDGNLDRILKAIELARDRQVRVLCLPELCISGYGCEDAFHSPGVHETSLEVLREIIPRTQGMVVSVGLPLFVRGGIYNVAALLCDGALGGFVGKQNLAGEGLHYEPRWFKPWPSGQRIEFDFGGQVAADADFRVPMGDLLFDVGGVRMGFEICEDAWVAERPGGRLARQGVDILLNPSASHFAFGKHDVRKRFVQEGSRAFSVVYLYANLLGNEAGRAIYDGDAMIASGGQLVAKGPRFSFEDVRITSAIVDLDGNRMARAKTSSFRPQLDAHTDLEVALPLDWPNDPDGSVSQGNATSANDDTQIRDAHDRERINCNRSHWESSGDRKEHEFTRAIALGLFDYMRKSRSRGFVVSLSGGADSAAVTVLSSLALQLAVEELGWEGCMNKLPHLASDPKRNSVKELLPELLTCVYQSTQNSGTVTREAARAVAAASHARFYEWDVNSQVNDYVGLISQAIGRKLDWTHDDIALQNIQARTRAPSVWLLANVFGALLLSTSNRSEAAVGYATMDGDTCGGLSPIAGIDKAFLRHWLRWMEAGGFAATQARGQDDINAHPDQSGPDGPSGPCDQGQQDWSALAKVNQQQPTAELRPQAANQTDEQDLMPYELLDAVERAAIRDKQTPLEVYQEMQRQFPEYRPQLAQWVERFFSLWCRNQWKRERYAPSFHVDDKNLDPKTWCRFPILSGGYQRELRQLRNFIATEEHHDD